MTSNTEESKNHMLNKPGLSVKTTQLIIQRRAPIKMIFGCPSDVGRLDKKTTRTPSSSAEIVKF